MRAKYESVLDLGKKINVRDGDVKEENGKLKITGVVATQHEKDLLWDEIKRVGGENPTDIMADIDVADKSIYALHTVKSGESLSKIAKHYYGKPMKYTAIFEANKNILKNPDVIHPGQELIIPNL